MEAARQRWRDAAPLIVVLLSGAALLWWCGLRGWYPHDEGLLGQSAQRVLRGEIPHRDFTDPYTGGLSLLNAAVFALWGERLEWIRRAFDFFAWCWLALLYLLARRSIPGWGAALAALIAFCWSIPIYPAAMPSWYVLFLITAAVAMLTRSGATHRSGALFGAGVCLGLALLFKITALYAIAGVMMGFGHIRQLEGGDRRANPLLLIGTGAFLIAAVAIVASNPTRRVLLHVLVPTVALAGATLWIEIRTLAARGMQVDARFNRQVATVTAGIVVPVVPFLGWLASHQALAPLLHSLAGVTGQRALYAHQAPPSLVAIFWGAMLLALLTGIAVRHLRLGLLVVAIAALWLLAWRYSWAHQAIWLAVRGVLPVGAVVLAARWVTREQDPRQRRPDHILIAFTASTLALSQFPFAAEIYFAYVAPLTLLALLPLVPSGRLERRHVAVTGGALLLFSLAQVIPGTPLERGMGRADAPLLEALPGSHGGLMVPQVQAREYRALLEAIASIPDTLPLWTGPDAPEVAFLAGRVDRNPNFFSFLDPSGKGTLPDGEALVQQGVRTVVVQLRPSFSLPIDSAALGKLARQFPQVIRTGTFEIRWREAMP